jgi:hypothetical protein
LIHLCDDSIKRFLCDRCHRWWWLLPASRLARTWNVWRPEMIKSFSIPVTSLSRSEWNPLVFSRLHLDRKFSM